MTPTPQSGPYRDAVPKYPDHGDEDDVSAPAGKDRYHHVASNGLLVCPGCGAELLDQDGMPDRSLDLVDENGRDVDAPDAHGDPKTYHRKCKKSLVAEKNAAVNRGFDEFGPEADI